MFWLEGNKYPIAAAIFDLHQYELLVYVNISWESTIYSYTTGLIFTKLHRGIP